MTGLFDATRLFLGETSEPDSSTAASSLNEWSVVPSCTDHRFDRGLSTLSFDPEGGFNTATPSTVRQCGQVYNALYQRRSERSKTIPSSKLPNVSHARKTSPDHVKRPRNAFILFRSHTVAENLIPKEVEKDHRNISRIISHMWKSLDDAERSMWTSKALKEKEEHKKLYPNYKYKPESRTSTVTRRNVKKLENGDEECQEIADIILKAQGRSGLMLTTAKAPKLTSKRVRKEPNAAGPRKSRKKCSSIEAAASEMLNPIFLSSSVTSKIEQQSSPKSLPASAHDLDGDDQVDAPESIAMQRRASSAPPAPFPFLSCLTGNVARLTEDVVCTGGTCEAGSSPAIHQKLVHFNPESKEPQDGHPRRAKSRPVPIFNTWQFGICGDHDMPMLETFPTRGECSNLPSSISDSPVSASKKFFNPWTHESSSNPMLISPMRSTIKDLRRTSSMACLQSDRKFSSSGIPRHLSASKRASHSSDTINLFEEAARAAAANLEAELDNFPIDSSLHYDRFLHNVDDHPVFSHSNSLTRELSRDRRWSPRLSFCGSTLAAAARDWTNRTNGRDAVPIVQHREMCWSDPPASNEQDTDTARSEKLDSVQSPSLESLKGSIERAVTDVLQKLQSQLGDKDKGAALTREILASLGSQLLPGCEASSSLLSDSCDLDISQSDTRCVSHDDTSRLHTDAQESGRKQPTTADPRRSSSHYASPLQLALFH